MPTTRFFIKCKRQKRGEIKSGTLEKKVHASSCQVAVILIIVILANLPLHAAINISSADAQRIGKRIWQNECGGTIAGLTSWNTGENFASLGIGHFIWYPKGERGPFDESFPKFVDFAELRRAKLPPVLRAKDGCPWKSRTEFYQAAQSAAMKELRAFLAGTIDLQAEFLVKRLRDALPKMLVESGSGDQAGI